LSDGCPVEGEGVIRRLPRPASRLLYGPVLGICAIVLSSSAAFAAGAAAASRPSPLKSGIEFASADIRAMQADDFANPGMLWVERGERLWREPAGAGGRTCASCHGEAPASMKGVAARYPRIDPGAARLVDLEGRINLCRSRNQQAPPLAHESDELLALTAYVAHQSRGMPSAVVVDRQNHRYFERGRALYHQRIGQMNLSCAHCHDRNWGKRLLAETISQGHGNAYPAYRLEWQTVGSLQRRIRACFYGVRAEMPPYGAQELIELELFLAWRSSGLASEAPGVRR
jgi:sulfur-oxidizing protein SoxA